MIPNRIDYIAKVHCVHRHVYRLQSRNLRFGVYDKEREGFMGIRTKFGHRYLFMEFHWDTGAPYGTAKPKEDLDIWIPATLTLNACTHMVEEKWVRNEKLFEILDKVEKSRVYVEDKNHDI